MSRDRAACPSGAKRSRRLVLCGFAFGGSLQLARRPEAAAVPQNGHLVFIHSITDRQINLRFRPDENKARPSGCTAVTTAHVAAMCSNVRIAQCKRGGRKSCRHSGVIRY